MSMLGTQYVRRALDHWKRWRTAMYLEMQQNGTLDAEAQRASREAANQVATLMESGMQRHEAEEMVLPDLITLAPEPGVD